MGAGSQSVGLPVAQRPCIHICAYRTQDVPYLVERLVDLLAPLGQLLPIWEDVSELPLYDLLHSPSRRSSPCVSKPPGKYAPYIKLFGSLVGGNASRASYGVTLAVHATLVAACLDRGMLLDCSFRALVFVWEPGPRHRRQLGASPSRSEHLDAPSHGSATEPVSGVGMAAPVHCYSELKHTWPSGTTSSMPFYYLSLFIPCPLYPVFPSSFHSHPSKHRFAFRS